MDQLRVAAHMAQIMLYPLVAELACKIKCVSLQHIRLACDEIAGRYVIYYLGVFGIGELRHSLAADIIAIIGA